MKKKFIFIFATPSLKVTPRQETEESLLTRRFPESDDEHADVKRFCERANAGDFIETKFSLISCTKAINEEDLTLEELKNLYRAKGDDPDKFIASVRKTIDRYLK